MVRFNPFTGTLEEHPTSFSSLQVNGPLTVGVGGSIRFQDTVWDDLRFPSNAINPPGAAADPTRSSTTGMLEFSGTVDHVIAGQVQMPHDWAAGTIIRPHIHVWFPTASVGVSSRWKLEVNRADANTDFEAAYGSYITVGVITINNPNNARKEVLQGWGDLPMTNLKESAVIMWRISRLALSDALDNDTSNIVLLDVDFHYQRGKLGTDNELPT